MFVDDIQYVSSLFPVPSLVLELMLVLLVCYKNSVVCISIITVVR